MLDWETDGFILRRHFVLTLTIIPSLTRLEVVLHDQLPNSKVQVRGDGKSKLQFRGLKDIVPTNEDIGKLLPITTTL